MKVALCLSGQPRNFKKAYYKGIKENIIAVNNNCDVFIHAWWNEEEVGDRYRLEKTHRSVVKKNTPEKIRELYNPKRIQLEKQRKFDKDKYIKYMGKYKKRSKLYGAGNDDENTINQGRTAAWQSMFYSIYKSNELKKQYEKEKNFKYDAVIRCRFDLRVVFPIIAQKLELNNYIYAKDDCTHTSFCVNDHLAISSSQNMDIYSDTYNHLDELVKQHKVNFVPEILLGKWLEINNLSTKHIKYNLPWSEVTNKHQKPIIE